jgi:hypothetical protein
VRRFQADLARAPTIVTQRLQQLLRRAPTGEDPVADALSLRSFPIFGLPLWASRSLGAPTDHAFQAALAASSLHGYYFIRLIDNVMDGDGPPELAKLLPLAGPFHSGFERAYRTHFPPEHPFWADYDTLWGGSAFATVEDAFLEVIDAETFAGVSGRKFSASTIPVAAVLHRLGMADALPGWRELVDRLGGFYQMVNDLLDWHHDARAGIRTFFLSEATRRRREGEPLAAWVVREGFSWAVAGLDASMVDLEQRAAAVTAPDLGAFLIDRSALLRVQLAEAENALRGVERLVAAFV